MCHESITWPISGGAPSSAERESIEREDTTLPVYVARPEGDGKRPGLVLVHDIFGPREFYRDMAGRLAEQGYLTALPDLFVRQGELQDDEPETRFARMGALDKDLALEDILATVRFVRDQQRRGRTGRTDRLLHGRHAGDAFGGIRWWSGRGGLLLRVSRPSGTGGQKRQWTRSRTCGCRCC